MLKIITFPLLTLITLSCPNEMFCRQCEFKEDSNICKSCSEAVFDLKTEKCVPVTDNFPHCIEFNKTNNLISCSRCIYGFRLNNKNECEPCDIKECAVCQTDKQSCDICLNSKTFDTDKQECSSKKRCEIDDCQMCDKNARCIKCQSGSSFDKNGKCKTFKPNCLYINPERTIECLTCDFGYYITNDGDCLPNVHKGTHWIIKILFWLFVLGGFIAIGYLFYNKYKEKKEMARNNIYEEYVSVN